MFKIAFKYVILFLPLEALVMPTGQVWQTIKAKSAFLLQECCLGPLNHRLVRH